MENNSNGTSVVVNGLEIGGVKKIYISGFDLTYKSDKRQSIVDEMQKWLSANPKNVIHDMGKIVFIGRDAVKNYIHSIYGMVTKKTMLPFSIYSGAKDCEYNKELLRKKGAPVCNNNMYFYCSGCEADNVLFIFKPFSEDKSKFYLDTQFSACDHFSTEALSQRTVPCTCNVYHPPQKVLQNCHPEVRQMIFDHKDTSGFGRRDLNAHTAVNRLSSTGAFPIQLNANQFNKVSSIITKQVLEEHESAINLIEPLLQEIKRNQESFEYIVVRNNNNNNVATDDEMKRVIIMMPYAVSYFNSKYSSKYIGLDGSHNKNVVMESDQEQGEGIGNNENNKKVLKNLSC